MKRNARDNKYDWLDFSRSYLDLADVGCEKLLAPSDPTGPALGIGSNLDVGAELYVPIVFNIKHGIECYLKTLSHIIDGDYPDTNHDLIEIFAIIKRKVLSKTIKPFKDQRENNVTQTQIDELPGNVEKLETLVLEFYTLPWLVQKIGTDYLFADKLNDIFRYPDNKARIKIKWDKIFTKIEETDIKMLREKIRLLHELFSEIGWVEDIYSTRDMHWRNFIQET